MGAFIVCRQIFSAARSCKLYLLDIVTFLLIHKKVERKKYHLFIKLVQIARANSCKVTSCHSLALLIVPRAWTRLIPRKTPRMRSKIYSKSQIRVYLQDDNHYKENTEDQDNIEKISS